MARPAIPARAISLSRVPEVPVHIAGAAAALVIGNAAATARISGAAVAQPEGTDNPPTTLPSPRLAVTAIAAERVAPSQRALSGLITGIAAELRQLAELHDSKVVTDEEFNELKQRLLAR